MWFPINYCLLHLHTKTGDCMNVYTRKKAVPLRVLSDQGGRNLHVLLFCVFFAHAFAAVPLVPLGAAFHVYHARTVRVAVANCGLLVHSVQLQELLVAGALRHLLDVFRGFLESGHALFLGGQQIRALVNRDREASRVDF